MKNIWFPILILLNAFCIAHAQSNPDGGHKADSRNMRLVGAHDLQGRSAFQPIIVQQGKRWIAYVGHHGGSAVNSLTGQKEANGTSILDVTVQGR